MVTPNSTPPWVRAVEINVTVEGESIPVSPATEAPAGDIAHYAGVAESYQACGSWTVSAGKIGELKEILFISDDYDHTVVRIIVAGVTLESGWSPTSVMPIIYEDLRLAAGDVVSVEVMSDDGTAIDVDVIIVGKEIG